MITTNRPLPFDALSPLEFERLCLWLVEREGYERAEHLGASGGEQGRDIVAWRGDEQWAFQCKRVQSFGPRDALRELEKVLALAEGERPAGILFLVTCNVSDQARREARERCQQAGMACGFWAATELDQKVKQHPEIVDEFFYATADMVRELREAWQGGGQEAAVGTGAVGTEAAGSGGRGGEAVVYDTPGGTLSHRSRVYVRRRADGNLERRLLQPGRIILIRGNTEMGKSSLLASGLAYAEQQGTQTIRIDFQGMKPWERGLDPPPGTAARAQEADPVDHLLQQIAIRICRGMDRRYRLEPERVTRCWEMLDAPNKLLGFVQEQLLPRFDVPVILAMDEVNVILNTPLGGDFWSLLRTWQHEIRTNARAWDRLTLVIVFSTEPYLLAEDITPLQWTIGTKIEVREFTLEEMRYLAHQYGDPLSPEELQEMAQLLGGHPYLTHTAVHEMVDGEFASWPELAEKAADQEYSPFRDHLIRRLSLIRKRPNLETGLRQVVQESTCPDPEIYLRLQAAGLVQRKNQGTYCRYQLYERYFRSYL